MSAANRTKPHRSNPAYVWLGASPRDVATARGLIMIGRKAIPALLAILALIAAACSSSGGAAATASPTAAASVAPPSEAASPSASAEESPTESASGEAGEDYPLAVATVSAGSTLTGENAMTLY